MEEERGQYVGFEVTPKEHYGILADIRVLKQAVADGKVSMKEMADRLDELEERARTNEYDHKGFVKLENLQPIYDSMRKLEGSILVQTPKQVQDNGGTMLSIIGRNPTYLLWGIMGMVAILMVIMGYRFSKIIQVLQKIQ